MLGVPLDEPPAERVEQDAHDPPVRHQRVADGGRQGAEAAVDQRSSVRIISSG
jgi:hypothetical protein